MPAAQVRAPSERRRTTAPLRWMLVHTLLTAASALLFASAVESACALLRREWPFAQHAPHMAPLALLQQLYFLLPPDRTKVDRQVAALQAAGSLRVFRLFASAGTSVGAAEEGSDLAL